MEKLRSKCPEYDENALRLILHQAFACGILQMFSDVPTKGKGVPTLYGATGEITSPHEKAYKQKPLGTGMLQHVISGIKKAGIIGPK